MIWNKKSGLFIDEFVLKCIFVDSSITHLGTIIIDGAGRTTQKISYLFTISNTQSEQCVDT